MTDRSPVPASDIYNVDRWGDSYFRIDDQGQLCVRPNGEQGGQATLEAVLESCRAAGLRAPVLARFSGILRQRVKLLAGAFREAIESHQYQGDYTPVYPIKVNQQRRVVHEILRARDEGERCLLYTSPSPRDRQKSRMPSSA